MNKIDDSKQIYEALYSNEGLSFWGGVDPITGIIIDQMHPLCGQSVVDKVLWYVWNMWRRSYLEEKLV